MSVTADSASIRAQAIARLIAFNVAGGNVVDSRARPFSPAEAPCVNVFSPGYSGQNSTAHIARFKRAERLAISGAVRLPDGTDSADWQAVEAAIGAATDALEVAIMGAVVTDPELQALANRITGIQCDKGIDIAGTEIRGIVKIVVTLELEQKFEPVHSPDLGEIAAVVATVVPQ